MSKRCKTLVWMSVLLFVPSARPDNIGVPYHVESLKSQDPQERLEGAQVMTEQRQGTIKSLRDILQGHWETSFRGTTHLAIQELGEWRSREATPLLTSNIDWELAEESMPQGKKYPPWIRFPCAVALRNIGGREVRYEVYKEMPKRTDERSLMLMAWVLQSIDGPEVAEMILEQKSQSEVENAELQQTLKKLITYVKQGDGVFANFPG